GGAEGATTIPPRVECVKNAGKAAVARCVEPPFACPARDNLRRAGQLVRLSYGVGRCGVGGVYRRHRNSLDSQGALRSHAGCRTRWIAITPQTTYHGRASFRRARAPPALKTRPGRPRDQVVTRERTVLSLSQPWQSTTSLRLVPRLLVRSPRPRPHR